MLVYLFFLQKTKAKTNSIEKLFYENELSVDLRKKFIFYFCSCIWVKINFKFWCNYVLSTESKACTASLAFVDECKACTASLAFVDTPGLAMHFYSISLLYFRTWTTATLEYAFYASHTMLSNSVCRITLWHIAHRCSRCTAVENLCLTISLLRPVV